MKGVIWKNKSNGQLCLTVPRNTGFREGEIVDFKKGDVKTISYVGVVADLFHYGHLQSIRFAQSVSDYNVVGVLTDRAVEAYRARPIANLQERRSVISSLNCVDRVMVQHSRDPTDNLKKLHEEFPNATILLVHGSDIRHVHGSKYVKQVGGKTLQHPYYERLSNYKILKELSEGAKAYKDIEDFTSYIHPKSAPDAEDVLGNKTIIYSKAHSLLKLRPFLTKSKINDLSIFSLKDFDPKKLLGHVRGKFSAPVLMQTSKEYEFKPNKGVCLQDKKVTGIDPSSLLDIEDAFERLKEGLEQSDNLIISKEPIPRLRGNALLSVKQNNDTYDTYIFYDNPSLTDIHFRSSSKTPAYLKNLFIAMSEIKQLIPGLELDLSFVLGDKNEVVIDEVKPLTKNFVHAWGGRTSLQSLECHTLRYVKYPGRLGNSVTRSILCEINNTHHTVYFEQKDRDRMSSQGTTLLNPAVGKSILNSNLEQIKKYDSFFVERNFSAMSNIELCKVYTGLINLVMENGSFFPYSREEVMQPVKEHILKMVRNDKELFQLLTTPTEDDLFLQEKLDKLSLITGKISLIDYTNRHAWRFINTYDKGYVQDFVLSELKETSEQKLKTEIENVRAHNASVNAKQQKHFVSNELKRLCEFVQKCAILRLQNKRVWAGYEYLYLDLFLEISKRLGLSCEDYLFSYTIEDTQNFLRHGRQLSLSEVQKRQQYFNFEVFPDNVEYSYVKKYEPQKPLTSKVLEGDAGNLGRSVGRALIVTDDSIQSLVKLKKEMTGNDIYITTMTHPAMVSLLSKSKGIITDEGGVTSHAAIVSRELNIPCLVGTKVATQFFKTGDWLELDAYNNFARKLSSREALEYESKNLSRQNPDYTLSTLRLSPKKPCTDMPYVIPITQANDNSFSLVGGKGKNLIKTSRLHTVPSGFCVTRRLYDEILSAYSQTGIRLDESNSKQIIDHIKNFKVSPEFNAEVQTLAKWPSFAVRSSASSEDSETSSFAGQFKTYLGVSKSDIVPRILDCIASVFEENVLAYLREQDVNMSNFFMSVVVQNFLQSEKAGVLFTKNPTDPERLGFVVDANFGVGESVVSGEVKPDRYIVTPDTKHATVSGDKQSFAYHDGKLTKSKKSGRVLSDGELNELYALGELLRDHYDCEIEYEWAFFQGKLYLLQVRPITTLEKL